MTEEIKQSNDLAEYRKWLVAAEQKSQEGFDKTVLSLSGGALGISFVFLKDIIGPKEVVLWGFLLAAWLSWAFSTFSVLTSYYLSHLALRRAIFQVDCGTIYSQKPGGVFNCWTAILNATGVVLFLVGVCCITVFAGANLSTKGGTNDLTKSTITTGAYGNTAASGTTATTSNTTAASGNTAATSNPTSAESTNDGQASGGRLLSSESTTSSTKK